MIRFLIITSTYESYFEDPNVCLAHTGLFLTCAGLVFWGFDMSMTAAGGDGCVFFCAIFKAFSWSSNIRLPYESR